MRYKLPYDLTPAFLAQVMTWNERSLENRDDDTLVMPLHNTGPAYISQNVSNLTLSKIVANNILNYHSEKKRLDISCESSA